MTNWMLYFDAKKSLKKIEKYIDQIEEEKDLAYKEMKEWNKDKEIQKLKNEIKKLKEERVYSFSITFEEKAAIKEWINKHAKEKHGGDDYAGTIGGRYTYEFTPTSIGDVGVIKCNCGEGFCFRELS